MATDGDPKPDPNEERIKMFARVVCICKGINLGRVLKAMEGCETVADVNRKAGTGSGGCAGERCGPRIKMLLRKKREMDGGGGSSGSGT
jgi:NAD(P)H-nitrite reductase large subunit